MDRATGLDQSHNRCRTKCFLKEVDLLDIWRVMKPNGRAYSFYSSTTHSCIDYFFVSIGPYSQIQNCFYDNIVLSDHAPFCLVYEEIKLVKDINGTFNTNGYRMMNL